MNNLMKWICERKEKNYINMKHINDLWQESKNTDRYNRSKKFKWRVVGLVVWYITVVVLLVNLLLLLFGEVIKY